MTQQNIEYKLHIADGFYSSDEILKLYLQALAAKNITFQAIGTIEVKDIMKGDK